MTEVERQALRAELDSHLARVSALVAVLAGFEPPPTRSRDDPFVRLKVVAFAWGVTPGAIYKQLPRLRREYPGWIQKRGARHWLHEDLT